MPSTTRMDCVTSSLLALLFCYDGVHQLVDLRQDVTLANEDVPGLDLFGGLLLQQWHVDGPKMKQQSVK